MQPFIVLSSEIKFSFKTSFLLIFESAEIPQQAERGGGNSLIEVGTDVQ